ncbi:FAD/FMN-containing dehydrogenase [Saccharata proteae CBS 121410]|uniref:FAD/FMN-containing dehydrogenase n=1 Tax=Saccharata proteae CBS 121410 TaxID=1314787 RepID=A0A9P4HPX9_9PEZI|nr:FAD/FMN-containing dehydrogenase [Saccharata proteae CBS 121410]
MRVEDDNPNPTTGTIQCNCSPKPTPYNTNASGAVHKLIPIAGKRISGSLTPAFRLVSTSATQSLNLPPNQIPANAPIRAETKQRPDCQGAKPADESQTYEKARIDRVFNHRRPDRHPIAVVEATQESHVVDTVRLAIERQCRVSVRSGGHSWAAWSVRDEAILLDLGGLKKMLYDEETGVASVSPSMTGRELNRFLATKGRMFAGGHCPDVGLGGFLLQGGMGWNCKNWGWACESVVGIDVVTATGDILHCSKDEHSDLFWAARGAGPGFPAIVTTFHLQTREAITASYDPDTEIVCLSLYPPDSTPTSPLTIMILLVTFKHTPSAALAALQPAHSTHPPGTIHSWFNRPDSLENQYASQDAANPLRHRYCVDNAYISNDADVAAVLEPAFTSLPTRKSFSLWYSMAPCSRRKLPDMALSMQSDHYFATYVVWEDEKDDVPIMNWVQDVMRRVEKSSEGAYLGDADFQIRRTRFWGEEQGRRLGEVRRKWDEEGRVCGYLDAGDGSGVEGLANVHEWEQKDAKM